MVILVGKPDALDQYFMKNPADLFERPFEAAVLDPNNPYVVEAHLPCAAAEIPVTLKDAKFWGSDLTCTLKSWKKEGLLNRTAEGEPAWFHQSGTRNSRSISVLPERHTRSLKKRPGRASEPLTESGHLRNVIPERSIFTGPANTRLTG